MNTPEAETLPDDALFNIERRIAQRADELAKSQHGDRDQDLMLWRQAEHEIWQAEGMRNGAEAATSNGMVTT